MDDFLCRLEWITEKKNQAKVPIWPKHSPRKVFHLMLLNLNHPQTMMADSRQHLGLEGEHGGRYCNESSTQFGPETECCDLLSMLVV